MASSWRMKEGSEVVPRVQVTSSAIKPTLKHPFFPHCSTLEVWLSPFQERVETLVQHRPPPPHTHHHSHRRSEINRHWLLWYLLYTRDGVRGWACWNKPWGFMVILPDCHLGWSWTNLGHLGQIECNNVIDTLEAASSNSTQTLWNSDDVFVNIFTNTFFHFIESTNLS